MKKFIKSVEYWLKWILYSFLHERNIKIQICLILIFAIILYFLNIKQTEWIIFIFTSFTMLAVETINSSIEKLADEVTLKHKKEIWLIKDLASGASGLIMIWFVTIRIWVVFYNFW